MLQGIIYNISAKTIAFGGDCQQICCENKVSSHNWWGGCNNVYSQIHRIPGEGTSRIIWVKLSWQNHGPGKMGQSPAQLNLKNVQSWGVHHFPGQIIPMGDCYGWKDWKWFLLCPIRASPGVPGTPYPLSFPCGSVYKGTLHLLCGHPLNSGTCGEGSPQLPLLKAEQTQVSQPSLTCETSQPLDPLCGPFLDPLQHNRDQTWTQCSRCDPTNAEQSGIMNLPLIDLPFLMPLCVNNPTVPSPSLALCSTMSLSLLSWGVPELDTPLQMCLIARQTEGSPTLTRCQCSAWCSPECCCQL